MRDVHLAGPEVAGVRDCNERSWLFRRGTALPVVAVVCLMASPGCGNDDTQQALDEVSFGDAPTEPGDQGAEPGGESSGPVEMVDSEEPTAPSPVAPGTPGSGELDAGHAEEADADAGRPAEPSSGGGSDAGPSAPMGLPAESCPGGVEAAAGLELCPDGATHRVNSVTCESIIPRPTQHPPVDGVTCLNDEECVALPYGYCLANASGSTRCQYGCVVDSDCANDEVCHCGDPVGTCEPADCRTSSDCPDGERCVVSRGDRQRGFGYLCTSEADECLVDSDCTTQPRVLCSFTPEGRRCQPRLVSGKL